MQKLGTVLTHFLTGGMEGGITFLSEQSRNSRKSRLDFEILIYGHIPSTSKFVFSEGEFLEELFEWVPFFVAIFKVLIEFLFDPL